jgi:hypothetical protein
VQALDTPLSNTPQGVASAINLDRVSRFGAIRAKLATMGDRLLTVGALIFGVLAPIVLALFVWFSL